MQKRRISLHRYYLINVTVVVFLALAATGYFWINSEISKFQSETEALRASYIDDQKSTIKREVERAYDFVQYMQSQTEKRLGSSIENRVNEAYAIAANIYEAERGIKTIDAIKSTIREALRPIRYNDGRGYFFAFNMDGIEKLFPVSSQMEGRDMNLVKGGKGELVVPEMIALIKEKGEGYYKYYWPKPGEPGYFPKIAYVKLFAPLHWVIGTGEYIDDVEHDIQKECIQWISKIKFGKDGYVFVGRWDGMSLSGPQTGKNMMAVEDVNGVKIVQELIAVAKSGGGYVDYVLPKFEGKKQAPKISYAVGVPHWKWYIGAGLYVDEIENAILARQAELNRRIYADIRTIVSVLLVVLAIVAVFVRFLFVRLGKNLSQFSSFFNRAATQAETIDQRTLYFSEFGRLADSANRMVENRRQAERALRESEEKYRSLFQLSNEGILLIKDSILDCNEAACVILKCNKSDLLGKSLVDISPPTLRDGTRVRDIQKTIWASASSGHHPIFEWQCYRKDGSLAELEFSFSAIKTAEDHFLLASGRDITELKHALNTVAESEMRLKAFIENSPDAFYAHHDDGLIVQVNEAVCHRLGYSREELIGRPVTDFEAKITPQEATEMWRQLAPGQVNHYEGVHRRKDGSQFPVEIRRTAIDIHGEKLLIGFASDITERKEIEQARETYQQRLIQAQKMEAIGTLAGGIAHDFNNLLMGILGHASLMALNSPASNPFTEHIQAITDYTTRATDLSKQLLGIARGGKYEVRPLDVNDVVRQSAEMFGRTRKEIRIHTDFYEPAPTAAADRRQIEQVLLNLYINAWQAMPDGGDIFLKTSVHQLEETFCKPHEILPGAYVRITVTDTGIGIDETIRHRIFDPFFTTKEKSRGSGLGLASVYGIIKNHSGAITVVSEAGRGTTFKLFLPASVQAVHKESPNNKSLAHGGETILMVDDEAYIVEVGQAMLERLGYRVITADSGEKAVEIVRQSKDEINLVILDMIMPGMDGRKTFDRIRSIHPTLPVLISSGFAVEGMAADVLRKGANGFIQKPFNLAQLSSKVRLVLDDGGPDVA